VVAVSEGWQVDAPEEEEGNAPPGADHWTSHDFLRIVAIHSAKEISRTSGLRRSTARLRSLHPAGGPLSSLRRSSPARLFFEYFITRLICVPIGTCAQRIVRARFEYLAIGDARK
jgi:hypothetical protein